MVLLQPSRALSKRKRWVVSEILRKNPSYDHDNLGKDSVMLEHANVRRADRSWEQEVTLMTAAAVSDADGGGGAAEDRDKGAKLEAGTWSEAPGLGAAPQIIGLGPTRPKYASFRGFASAVWGFS